MFPVQETNTVTRGVNNVCGNLNWISQCWKDTAPVLWQADTWANCTDHAQQSRLKSLLTREVWVCRHPNKLTLPVIRLPSQAHSGSSKPWRVLFNRITQTCTEYGVQMKEMLVDTWKIYLVNRSKLLGLEWRQNILQHITQKNFTTCSIRLILWHEG
jgi:hypothetical protein